MSRFRSKLGTDIPLDTRGILYICDYKIEKNSLEVVKEFIFNSKDQALIAYANISNPESQIVLGDSYKDVIKGVQTLHLNMKNSKWLNNLKELI